MKDGICCDLSHFWSLYPSKDGGLGSVVFVWVTIGSCDVMRAYFLAAFVRRGTRLWVLN